MLPFEGAGNISGNQTVDDLERFNGLDVLNDLQARPFEFLNPFWNTIVRPIAAVEVKIVSFFQCCTPSAIILSMQLITN